ncbi:MAG TPA: hypothetical protein DCE56_09020 [Cyanobacteria bacterium UBA8553]|nr:hypothetical protein [Cyanobacteria bacterium UBA8553]
MPDGDNVHSRLARLYQKPYQWLYEGKADRDECARIAMEALKRDLMKKGNLPIMLAKRMEESLERAINDATNKSGVVDWAALNVEFDRLEQQANGSHYLKTLALDAGKSFINDLRYKRVADTGSASEAILKHYMYKVYESEFKRRIPLTLEHHAGIDAVTLNRRIEEIQADILAAISKWAKQATEDQNVANLRLPRRPSLKPVDLDEDLLCTAD